MTAGRPFRDIVQCRTIGVNTRYGGLYTTAVTTRIVPNIMTLSLDTLRKVLHHGCDNRRIYRTKILPSRYARASFSLQRCGPSEGSHAFLEASPHVLTPVPIRIVVMHGGTAR